MISPSLVLDGGLIVIEHDGRDNGPFLICGLGNPGRKYEGNRHNVGFQIIDRLAERWQLEFRRMRFKAYVTQGQIAGAKAILAKPMTFMNDSGQAVVPLLHWHKLDATQLLVVYDDLDLPLGQIRLRPSGSDGGHKGIRSIIRQLGSRDFSRVRVGIGRPEYGEPHQYVLNDFGPDQEVPIRQAYDEAIEAIEYWIQHGIQATMNEFNGR